MARRTTAKKIHAGTGAKYLNPYYKEPTPDEKKAIQAHGEPWGNRRWITTGCHGSRLEAERYMADNHPSVPKENIRYYGIRLAANVFDEETTAYLARAAARGFSAKETQ